MKVINLWGLGRYQAAREAYAERARLLQPIAPNALAVPPGEPIGSLQMFSLEFQTYLSSPLHSRSHLAFKAAMVLP